MLKNRQIKYDNHFTIKIGYDIINTIPKRRTNMEKIFDAHVHYSFGLPIEEMVRIFRKEFEDLNT